MEPPTPNLLTATQRDKVAHAIGHRTAKGCAQSGGRNNYCGAADDEDCISCGLIPMTVADPPPEAQALNGDSPCPHCGEQGLWRESVDVGVGTIHGPYGCECCGWSEATEYDRREGPASADAEHENRVCDQWGMAHWAPPRPEEAGS